MVKITVGGKDYLVGGIIFGGKTAIWLFIKHGNGTPMKADEFNKLPDADKLALSEAVQQNVHGMRS